ncbi:TonB-dependent receptor [Salinimonas sediminis]|uniref:TonB-dependent receptor n=1 Tax=Salinimonas sediminis TaxID=2303538 RepID=A0A346NRQ4_9ALTE|nr:TonB-dependent receptor [Salinimonas sediminis]AXR08211.1 TonB-dependent receptor [Salinimonas sediminis]
MKTSSAWLKRSALTLALATAGVASIPAYGQIEGATLRGKLSAPAAPQGKQVTAKDSKRGYVSKTTTRKDGSYVFVGLKPGTYEVSVDGQTETITLRVGQTAKLNFGLDEQAPDSVERITVSGSRIQNFTGGEVGTNITPELMKRLPQNNRNFLAFADLAPGVQVNTGADGSVSLRGGAQHQRNVNVFLDGVSQKDYVLKGGVTGQDSSRGNPFPQSAIGEYKVITQNYKAEYDQVGSTAITAVSRSGTNEFEGEVFVDYTDEGLREAEPNEVNGKSPSMIRHTGVTLAGPILKDKVHFLAAFERKTIDQPFDVNGGNGIDFVSVPSEYAQQLGRFTSGFEEDLFFGKLDWRISQDQALELSAKIRDESDVSGFGGASVMSYGVNREVEDNRYHLKHTFTQDAWQNEFRMTYEDSSWSPRPVSLEPGIVLQTAAQESILNLGGGRDFQDKGQKGWGIQNDFTWLDLQWHGYHVIKAGFKYKDIELRTLQQQPYNPQYYYNVEFNGPGAFDVVQPYRVEWGVPATGSVGGAVVADTRQFGIYLQDDWEVTDRLTLNIGVRWDYEEFPSYKDFETPPDLVEALRDWPNIENANYAIEDYISTGSERDYFTGAWQPRLGFSYIMDDAENHMLFGGYGRSYDRNQFDFLQLEQSAGSFAAVSYLFEGDAANPCDSASPSCLAWDPSYLTQQGLDGLISNIDVKGERFLLKNDMEVPYSDQFSIGVRSFWGDWNSELSIAHIKSKNGFNWVLGNRREDGSFFEPGTDWGSPWGFGVPGWGNLLLAENDGQTRANNVYFKLNRGFKDGWSVNLAYTFTDAEENRIYNEVFALDYETVDDYGWSDASGVSDHRVVITGSYDLPWNIIATGKFTWSSPRTYQNLVCADDSCSYQRTQPEDSDYHRFDLALSKDFATDYIMNGSTFWVRFDVQNLFNATNYRDFYLDPNQDNFEQANLNSSTEGGKRQLKLSAGWQF